MPLASFATLHQPSLFQHFHVLGNSGGGQTQDLDDLTQAELAQGAKTENYVPRIIELAGSLERRRQMRVQDWHAGDRRKPAKRCIQG